MIDDAQEMVVVDMTSRIRHQRQLVVATQTKTEEEEKGYTETVTGGSSSR